LNKTEENYADSFKTDIYLFFNDFNTSNPLFKFLESLNSFDDIESWINKLCSRIVLKFDSEAEQINDLIYDYLENG
jgi:hypothetical protein